MKTISLSFNIWEEIKMKKLISLLLVALLVFSMAACGTTQTPADGSNVASSDTSADSQAPADTSSDEKYELAVLVKALDSDYWQQLIVGAKKFEYENSDKVSVTVYGPTSEADVAEQTEMLDDIITKHPDGIAVVPTLVDNCNAGIESAMQAGIPVVTMDNQPTTDAYITHYATDNYVAGQQLAQRFVDELNARSVELKGKVGLISAMAGVQTLVDREGGFRDKLAEIAPDIELMEPQYVDNDIPKSLSAAETIYTGNKDDLLGFFASNNATGDGVAQFLSENQLGDQLVAVAFDADPAEVDSIRQGGIVAIAVQNPYKMGYTACQSLLELLSGEKTYEDFDKKYDTGVAIIDSTNVDSEDMAGIIDPFSLKLYE